MPYTKYFTKNNAQGIVIDDSSSTITFESGHSFPTDVVYGEYLITLDPPNGEIVKVTAASEDVSGVLTVSVTREQESTTYADHTSGTMGYMLFTAGLYNSISTQLEDIYTGDAELSSLDVTGNILVGGTVDGRDIATDGTKLDGIATGAEVNVVDSVNGFTGAITLVTGNISDTTSTQKYVTSSDITKLGYISVTQAVDLDTLESDTTSNNAKVSNATHTGDVIGSTSLTIDPTSISGRTGVTPEAGDYILLWDATDSTLKKSDVSTFLSGSGGGDVTGAASSIDRGIVIFDGTDGKLLNTCNVTISAGDDLENVQAILALDYVQLGANNKLTETVYYLYTDNSGVRKNVTFLDGDDQSWVIGEDSDFNFKIERYVSNVYVDTPLEVDYTTGNITTSGTINGRNISTDGTKLDYISVTQAVDLDTLESDTTTNNAKVTNADHTGEMTGSDTLTADPTLISNKTGVTPVAGDYVLLWDATDSLLKKSDVSTFLSGGGAVDSVNGQTGTVVLVTGNISDTTSTQKYVTSSDITKLGYISVTQAVDLDTMESNITTNNAKVTNATHTGDVIGSTSLTIDPTAISGKTGVTPVAGDYLLLWDDTDDSLKKVDASNFLSSSGGDVTGPASSTDNGIAIFNGTGGKTIKNSLVTIDTSSVTIPGFLTVTGQARHSTQTTLTTSGAVSWNINNNPKANLIITGDVTGLTISGINLNSEATLYFKQDSSSAYTVTWPGGLIWAGNTEPDLSTLDSQHIISFYSYDGTGLYGSHVSDDVVTLGGAVDSVNTYTGTVVLVTADISDSTSTQKYTTAGDITKLSYISVTQAVDLDTMESNISTNNAKVTNAAHTGDVTGADVLGIVPAAISGKTGVTPVSGDYLLLWDATDSLLKKVDASNFLGGGAVSSVNGYTGAVTLVTADISDTTSIQKYTTAGDITKLSYISVTQAVDLDTMESNIATNNSKVTNATHTGDVTGADVLGVVPAAISGKSAVTAVAGDYVLLWDATDSTLKKADVTDFISLITASSTSTFTNKRITKRVQAITDATGLVFNCDSYDSGYVTLTASRTLNNFTGTPTNHQTAMIEFIQGGSGSYTVTIDTTGANAFRLGADVTGLVLSTAVGKNDLALFVYSSDSTAWLLSSISKGY